MSEPLNGEDGANCGVGSEEVSSASEQPDEELQVEERVKEAPTVDETEAGGEVPEDEVADDVLDKEAAAREWARKGKGKALPKKKEKKGTRVTRRAFLKKKEKKGTRVTRRAGGPVIREPVEQVAPEYSDPSDEELDEPTEYEVYPMEINDDVLDALKKYTDLQLKEGTKDESKAYGSGHLVDVDSLLKLGIFSQVAHKMVRIGWGWLLTLDECRIPKVLCKEFISTFTFTGTTNLSAVSIQFDLFGERHVMSIDEWTRRLGIYTPEEMASGEDRKWERGTPGKQIRWDKNETWRRLTGKTDEHNYQNAQAYHLKDPILGICHIITVSIVNEMSSSFSKMPASSLYFLDRIEQGIRVHLGFWLIHT